ncbi:NADH-quinone oxidoreductase subunit J [Aureimonas leprariae]|uniref:NADH-quinone oxidoreductase subunit J n=1 Tax=Plantimonas leprariae TaxID=2615207 RepID=A0A7V7TXP4_9HYPH|nr:NADH-quinone oxidoreductase subunit J [Aureimonas leprariae]KAB0681954.1 NADH-quinone oxidoreductase subunit J [Aureimonas leprariae]
MLGLQALFFYIFAFIAVGSALMVVFSRSPVHSVLFLILTFVAAAGLFLLTGAEYLALLLIVVYVGAVAVLFLFVVMMLDVDFKELKRGALNYAPVGAIIGLVVFAELVIAVSGNYYTPGPSIVTAMPTPPIDQVTNIEALGHVLYTRYILLFQLAGLILFVAMVGAIVLTLRHSAKTRRQSIPQQVARNPATAIEIRKVKSGQGI